MKIAVFHQRLLIILFGLLAALFGSNTLLADPYRTTIDAFHAMPEVRPFFDSAYGYAVFPTIGKGGIGIGGAYGEGRVYRGGRVTGDTSVIQLSIGWQLGGQAYSEMIFFQNQDAYNRFTSGNFAFNAEASAVAITLGAAASASTQGGATAGAGVKEHATNQARNAYTDGMAIFTAAKGGLMYQAAIGGQKFSFTPR